MKLSRVTRVESKEYFLLHRPRMLLLVLLSAVAPLLLPLSPSFPSPLSFLFSLCSFITPSKYIIMFPATVAQKALSFFFAFCVLAT